MKQKVTLEDLKTKIQSVEYARMGSKTTICLLLLENGFEVLGSSACVHPECYNEEIGKDIAYEDAINRLWVVEGYMLQEQFYKEATKRYDVKEATLNETPRVD